MNYLFMGSLIEREKKFTGDKQIKAIVEKLLTSYERNRTVINAGYF